MNIKELLTKLIKDKAISIDNNEKKVVGLARFSTMNDLQSEYVKVAFSDGSGIYFPLSEDIVFQFDKKIGKADGIDDQVIVESKETILWKGVTFNCVNGNDYQFVKEYYIGTIAELEGEVRFSDYEDENGNVLSLGLNMFEGKRDDVYAVPLSLEKIS